MRKSIRIIVIAFTLNVSLNRIKMAVSQTNTLIRFLRRTNSYLKRIKIRMFYVAREFYKFDVRIRLSVWQPWSQLQYGHWPSISILYCSSKMEFTEAARVFSLCVFFFVSASAYEIPNVRIEVFSPRGFKASIPRKYPPCNVINIYLCSIKHCYLFFNIQQENL